MAEQPLNKAVEAKQHPQLRGLPLGVVQYNPYGSLETRAATEDRVMNDSNGSLIAVSYEARASGVKRNMRGDEARAACPNIQLVQVPTAHGKADLTLYRGEGRRVLDVLARLAKTERASIDECYLDLTEEAQRRLAACAGVPPLPCRPGQVHVMQEAGWADAEAWWRRPAEAWRAGERLLACAAAAVADLRAAIEAELGFTCSAGIAHTKLLAKLCSGLHKPAQQTVLPADAVPALLGPLPIPKLKGLGGKFGLRVMAELGVETVGQLAATPLSRLEAAFGDKDAAWLAALARGVTDDVVEERRLPKSVNCGKTFRGSHALRDLAAVHKWLLELGGELAERLEEDRDDNGRVPQLLTASFSTQLPWAPAQQAGAPVQATPGFHSTSRSCPLRKLSAEAIADDAAALVRRWAAEQGPGWSISSLFITAGNFVSVQSGASAITRFFKPAGGASPPPPGPPASAASSSGSKPATPAALPCTGGGQKQRLQPSSRLQQQDGQAGPSHAAGEQQQDGQAGPSIASGRQQQQEEVDEAVLAELPLELQQEIRAEQQLLRQQGQHVQRPNARVQALQRQKGAGSSASTEQDKRPGPSIVRLEEEAIDEAVLAELPPQLQKQVRADWAAQQRQGQHPPRDQQQQQQQRQQDEKPGPSNAAQQQQQQGEVDEAVLAELPPELQKEIRAEQRFQQMAARFTTPKPSGGSAAKGNSGQQGGSGGCAGAKRPGSGGAAAGTQRIDIFLKGKRPKR